MLDDLALQPRGIHGLDPKLGRGPDETCWWHPGAVGHCHIGLQLPHLLIHVTQPNLQANMTRLEQANSSARDACEMAVQYSGLVKGLKR